MEEQQRAGRLPGQGRHVPILLRGSPILFQWQGDCHYSLIGPEIKNIYKFLQSLYSGRSKGCCFHCSLFLALHKHLQVMSGRTQLLCEEMLQDFNTGLDCWEEKLIQYRLWESL